MIRKLFKRQLTDFRYKSQLMIQSINPFIQNHNMSSQYKQTGVGMVYKNDQEQKQKQKSSLSRMIKNLSENMKQFQQVINPNDDPKIKRIYQVLAVLVLVGVYYNCLYQNEIDFDQFMQYFNSEQIKNIKIVQTRYYGVNVKYAKIYTNFESDPKLLMIGDVNQFMEKLEQIQLDRGRMKDRFIEVYFQKGLDFEQIFRTIEDRMSSVIYALIVYVAYKSTKNTLGNLGGGSLMGMSKSKFKVYGIDKKIETKFKDVAGQDEAKLEIIEFVEFLKNPVKFHNIGAKIPRGALLSGPPGTGKTLLAKAVAGEAGVPFYTVSGSEFVEMFVGVGSSRVRDLFKQAKQNSPAIIFIDEIDAIGKKRSQRMSNPEKDNTLNQMLVEMDGFDTKENVIVLGATNQPDILDPALTRPGRLDRMIQIALPDLKGRKEIFMVHLRPLKLKLNQRLNIEQSELSQKSEQEIRSLQIEQYARRLATLTPGFSGADISNLCNEAAIQAARKNKTVVDSLDFEQATERILAGLEKKRIVNDQERNIVAVHESGHAVAGWFSEGCMPLLKLTIIPRSKGSLGFAQYLPKETGLQNEQELRDQITFILGGRCAEQFFFKKITTGAYDDLQKAYSLAYNYVTKWGMSEQIGLRGFKEDGQSKNYSEQTQVIIDQEIKKLIDQQTQVCMEMIEKYQDQVKALSEALLETETLDLNQITNVIGERPFEKDESFKEYLEVKQNIKEENEQ